ncbi:MAG TPA: amidase, partial [Gemmatimonadaceae bacterium]|nr:amidase [Gemmatimonadaceae bacterium]
MRILLLATACTVTMVASAKAQFALEETTIAEVHTAIRNGRLTCHDLVSRYLARIDAYDKKGPGINAIVVVNPDAL